jgi:glycerophosphoryl diester phosphodiesterase
VNRYVTLDRIHMHTFTKGFRLHPMIVRILLLFLVAAAASFGQAAKKPIVIAHRGGAALRPENTIAAFQNALKLGVRVLEFDMNVTKDGAIVIHHDSTVNPAICNAPPASGIKPGPIALLTLAEIRQFDCGSFVRPNSPRYRPVPGQKMPTLDEFLASIKEGGSVLLGETKFAAPGSGPAIEPDHFVDLIYAALKKHGFQDRFILQSGDYRTIDAIAKKDPTARTCLLNARRFKPGYFELARSHKATHLMLRADDTNASQVRDLQTAGLLIYSSTANRPSDWQKYVDLGMDGILTDDPAGLMEFLSGKKPTR